MSTLGRLNDWDMESEYRYWRDAAVRKGCPSEQFAFRWPLMRTVYAVACDAELSMDTAFSRFQDEARKVEMDDDTARMLFGHTWARILSESRR